MHKTVSSWLVDEENKPLCSSDKLTELILEANALMRNIGTDDVAVGDAILIEYDKEWADTNGIGRFGRLTVKNGRREYHAARKAMERSERLAMPERDFISYARKWEGGQYCPPPVSELVKDPETPEVMSLAKSNLISYETRLFERLRAQSVVTLVNPSMSTMVALKVAGGGKVTLTSQMDEKWAFDIRDFVNKSNGVLVMLPNSKIEGIAYLGSNSPLWYPLDPWVKAVLNPFVDQSHYFQSIHVDMQDTMVKMTVTKKPGYDVYSILRRDIQEIRYNPESVDRFLNTKKNLIWLESSFNLPIEEVASKKICHSPWFVSGKGDWVEIEKRQWKVRDKEVIDVKSPGTYVSKRSIIPPSGYQWTPYLEVGDSLVTYHCLSPMEVFGVHAEKIWIKKRGEAKIVTFDDLILSRDVVKKHSENGTFYNFSSGDLIKSEEGLRRSPVPTGKDLKWVYVDSEGKHYTEKSYSNDGVLVKLGGSKYRLPFAPGEVFKTLVFNTPCSSHMILPPSLAPGSYMAFPSNRSVVDNLHLLSFFSTKSLSIESLVEVKQDPEYGGMSTESAEVFKIETKIKEVQVYSMADFGIDVSRIMTDQRRSLYQMFWFVKRMPGVWIWKEGTTVTTQFVHEQNVHLQFLGERREGVYDGQYWWEVLKKLSAQYNNAMFTLPFTPLVPLRDFKAFLQANGFAVHFRRTSDRVYCDVRRGPW